MKDEKKFLESVSKTYKTKNSSITEFYTDTYINKFEKYINRGFGVELGCGCGYSTKSLSKLLDDLLVIEGSQNMINIAKETAPNNVVFENNLFEDIKYKDKFDYVFANYVLEHVEDTSNFIDICYGLLKKDGLLFLTVPNAKALSRQIAVDMGIIEDIYSLTQNDLDHGHRRVFDLEILSSIFDNSKFKIIERGGLCLKPVADYQFDKMLQQEIIDDLYLKALVNLSSKYLELSGHIYIVCKK